MATSQALPPKKDVVLALLEESDVFVHLDPRNDGVRVPSWFKKQAHLVLQIGLNMPVPIRDLEVDEEALSCTLSFNRSPFFCHIPWPAVYALVGSDGRAMVWPDDIPPEVAAQAAKVAQAAGQQAGKRAKLRRIGGPAAPSEPAEAPASEPEAPGRQLETASGESPTTPQPTTPSPPEKAKRPLPSYLRVVK